MAFSIKYYAQLVILETTLDVLDRYSITKDGVDAFGHLYGIFGFARVDLIVYSSLASTCRLLKPTLSQFHSTVSYLFCYFGCSRSTMAQHRDHSSIDILRKHKSRGKFR